MLWLKEIIDNKLDMNNLLNINNLKKITLDPIKNVL